MPDTTRGKFTSLLIAFLIILSAILVLDMAPSPVRTASAISGEITSDTVWMMDQTIDGNVYVKSGITLDIDAGVNVLFKGYWSLIVNGTLRTWGTKGYPVVFTTTDTSPAAGDWNSIHFNPGSVCDIQNASISYPDYGLYLDAPSQMTVRYSTFNDIANTGVFVTGTQYGNVSNCTLENCGDAGIMADNCQELDILGNNVKKIPGTGVALTNGAWATDVYYNNVTDCDSAGIYIQDSDSNTIVQNVVAFCGNGVDKGGIYLEGANTCYIAENKIKNNTGHGVYINGISGSSLFYNTVNENHIKGNTMGGLVAVMTDNLTVQDNIMGANALTDISIDASTYLSVIGNRIENGLGAQGIKVNSSSVGDISSNNITFGVMTGIAVDNCHDIDVTNNKVISCSLEGLSIIGSHSCPIRDNVIASNAGYGVLFMNSHDIWLTRNNVSRNYLSQLALETAFDIYSDNDTFAGPSTIDMNFKSGSLVEFINSTFDHESVLIDSSSGMKVYYYLCANIVNEVGSPLSCNVTVLDNESNTLEFPSTDRVSWLLLKGYQVISGSYDQGVEPYTITATHGNGRAITALDMRQASVFMTIQVFHPPDAGAVPSNITFPEGSSYLSVLGTLVEGNEPMTLTVGPTANLSASVSGTDLRLNVQAKDADWNGKEVLNLTFTDAYGTETRKALTATVEPVNDPPLIMPQIDDVHAMEGVGKVFLNLSQNGVDKDLLYEGDVLRWWVTSLSDQFEVQGNNETDNITLIVKDKDYFGASQLIVRLTDSHGTNTSQMMNVIIDNVNDPPVLAPIPDQVTDGNGTLVLDLTGKVSDIDDLPEVLRVWCLSKYSKVSGQVISFNYSTSMLKEENVTVVVTDGHPGENSDSVTFTVRVNRSALPADDDVIDDDINVTDDDTNVTDDDTNVTDDDVDDDTNTTDDDADDDINDDGGLSTYLVVLIIAVIILLLVGAGVAVFFVMRRKKRDTAAPERKPGRSVDAEVETSDVFKQRELAKAMGAAKAESMDQVPAVEAAPDMAPLTPMNVEVVTSDNPYADGLGASALVPPPESKPLLALPPAQIFEAEFQDMPKVDEIFISTKSGLLLKHFSYKETTVVDSDILSSMFTVIQNFIADSFGKRKVDLKKLTFGEFNILIDQGEHITGVIISSDKNVDQLEKPLHMMIQDIEFVNGDTLKDWDGSSDSLLGMQDCVNKLVNGGY